MKCWPVVIALLIFSLILPARSFSQDSQADSSFYETANNNVLQVYLSAIKEQSGLLNGRLNIPYPYHFESGSPYFQPEKFINGYIKYDGIQYQDIPILYDQLAAIVIMPVPDGWLQLTSEKVQHFSISGHQFIRLEKDSLNRINTGFYEEVYRGKINVLKRVDKMIREDIQSGAVLRFINQKDFYYIKDGTGYHLVKKKREILDVLQTHKQELQQYIKKNKLNFKKDMSNAIVQIASYYDGLTR